MSNAPANPFNLHGHAHAMSKEALREYALGVILNMGHVVDHIDAGSPTEAIVFSMRATQANWKAAAGSCRDMMEREKRG